MFHFKNGLYFQRDSLHNVDMIKTSGRSPENYRGPAFGEEDSSKIVVVKMTECEWASVIASMSAKGETAEQYRAALEFHTNN